MNGRNKGKHDIVRTGEAKRIGIMAPPNNNGLPNVMETMSNVLSKNCYPYEHADKILTR